MKTILISVALGALLFAGGLKVVERKAEPPPRVVEVLPAAVEVFEEPVETHVVSRVDPAWRKAKPRVEQRPVVRREDVEDHSFTRYAPLGLRPKYDRFSRAMPPKAAPARID